MTKTIDKPFTPTQRETWLDCARVIAALLIVFFHLPSSQFIITGTASSIRDFHSFLFEAPSARINFFFLVAGYFAKRTFNLQLWLKRLLLLFVTYIVWNTVCAFGLNDEISLVRIYGIGSSSKLCADYPMWFVRDLFVMTLFIPLMRYFTWLWVLVFLCLIFMFQINSYVIADSFALPSFDAWIIFLFGFLVNRFNLAQVKHFISKSGFLLLALWGIIISTKYFYPHFYALNEFLILKNSIQGLSIVLIGYAIGNYLPHKISLWIASFAPASFLCFAIHAPLVFAISLLIYKFSSSLISNSLLIITLPFAILALSKIVDSFINKRFPFLLPLLCNRFASKKKLSTERLVSENKG